MSNILDSPAIFCYREFSPKLVAVFANGCVEESAGLPPIFDVSQLQDQTCIILAARLGSVHRFVKYRIEANIMFIFSSKIKCLKTAVSSERETEIQ